MNQHSYNGSIKLTYYIKHNKKIEKELYQNKKERKENDHQRLLINNAYGYYEKLQINKQDLKFY